MDLAVACIEKKKRVNVKKRQIKYIGLKKSVNLTRKSEVQDRLDRILKVAYPYVSEHMGWTDAGREISIEDEEVDIKVNPLFVPLGEEDEIKVAAGVLVDEDGDFPGFVYVWIWKEEDEIFIQHGWKTTRKSLDARSLDDYEENEAIDIKVELDTDHLMESGQDYYGNEEEDSGTDDDDYFATDDDEDESEGDESDDDDNDDEKDKDDNDDNDDDNGDDNDDDVDDDDDDYDDDNDDDEEEEEEEEDD